MDIRLLRRIWGVDQDDELPRHNNEHAVNSTGVLVNPRTWEGVGLPYGSGLELHRSTLELAAQLSPNITSNANPTSDVSIPTAEESILSDLTNTPTSIMTNVTIPDIYGSIYSPVTVTKAQSEDFPVAPVHENTVEDFQASTSNRDIIPRFTGQDTYTMQQGFEAGSMPAVSTGYESLIGGFQGLTMNSGIIPQFMMPGTLTQVQNFEAGPMSGRSNYQGNPTLALNKPAPIDFTQNVRFWVTGLPPKITTSELLGAIRGVGCIFATNMVKPQEPVDEYDKRRRVRTAAASITFFSVEAGKAFMKKTLQFGEHKALIRYNRVLTAPMPRDGRSRVIIVDGHPDIVNPEYLTWLVDSWGIHYITDSMVYTTIGETKTRVFWAFGSFRAQAHAVYLRLRTEFNGRVYVRYGIDPCAAFERKTPRSTRFVMP